MPELYIKTKKTNYMKIKFEKKEYTVRHMDCKKRKCFMPFSGNGQYICRLFELGQCPKEYRDG